MKRAVQSVVAIAIAVALVSWVLIGTQDSAETAMNTNDANLVIHGYDAVAYFTEGRPVEGSADFQSIYRDALFQFASAEHKALFDKDPDKYAPAYGGYCAYGVTQKQKFDIDPNAWEIVGDRLFLQLDPGTRLIWLENRDGHIATADTLWPEIKRIPAEDL